MSNEKPLVVRYKNDLNETRFTLDLVEHRILLAAISKIDPETFTSDTYYPVYASDLESLGMSSNAYRDLKKATASLFQRYVEFKTGKLDAKGVEIYRKVHWIGGLEYKDGEGVIGVRFDPELRQVLTQIKNNYTKFFLNDLGGISSYYAIRIYTFLMQFAHNANGSLKEYGFFQVSLDELHNRLETGTKYKRFADFRRYVLDVAVKQINEGENTRLYVEYEEIKQKRRIVAIKFTFSLKAYLERQKLREVEDTQTLDLFFKISYDQAILSEAQIEMYSDFLSGNNFKKNEAGYDYKKFLAWLRKNKPSKEYALFTNRDFFKGWLAKQLLNPDFVMEIYDPWLTNLGFKPKKRA